MMTDDMALVREFAAGQSERAFETLVARHIHLVHSAALRQVRDPHLAEEITQAVFIILARKAKSLGEKTILSGWLYRTAQYASADALKSQRRRQYREQEAHMQSILHDPQTETAWRELSPLLDEAMTRLGQTDHDAVVLRYFENKSLREVGGALGLQERAAQKRIARALEKLRTFFEKRGVASTVAIIAGAISANSVQAAPAALAKSVTAVAIAKGAAASGSTLTLIKGALKIMAWTKAKTTIVAGVAVILAAGTTTLLVKHEHQAKGPIPQNSWAFVKYATPEAAFQSSLWAMSKGDMKTYLESLTPEFQGQYMETAGKGKSESELGTMNTKIATMIGDFQTVSNEVISSDEAILHFRSSRMGDATVPMKKIESEWKINGNITTGGPGNKKPQR